MLGRLKGSRSVQVALATNQRYGRDDGAYLSAAITYFGFLSIFPLLLLALSVVGFVLAGRPATEEAVVERITEALPGLGDIVGRNLQALVDARAGAGIVGLLGLLWSGAAVAGAARFALRRVFDEPQLTGIKRQLWLVGVTVALGLLALATTALAGLTAALDVPGPLGVVLVVLAPVVTAGLDFVLFLVSYRVLLRRNFPWGRLWPGALVAAVGWTILKFAAAWLVARALEGYAAVYGTFATTVAVLLVLYFAARLFVYGAELNAVLMERGGGAGMQRPNGDEGAGRDSTRSTPDLVRSIGGDMALLVRKEIELAKQEITEGITGRIKGAVGLAIGGVFGLFALGFLAAAVAWALDGVLAPWTSRLIVGGAFLLLAGLIAVVGLAKLRRGKIAPVRAKEGLKEDVEWAKAQLRH